MSKNGKRYYFYITASKTKVLYVGMTGKIRQRMNDHKTKADPDSFTAKYNVDQLVYFEMFKQVENAIRREKQVKKWRCEKKVKLIESKNPEWKDLSLEPSFDEGAIS